MSGIEEAWTTAKLLAVAGKQIDDLVDFDSIERVGNVVTVTVTPADDRDTAAILNFLFRSETPFLYS